MKVFNRIGQGLMAGAFSVAMLGGIGLPAFASDVNASCSGKTVSASERQELQSMSEKMLARVKVDDVVLQNMAAKLRNAPETQKVDIEAALLTEMVSEHHDMVKNWEGIHNQVAQFKASRAVHSSLAQNPASTGQK
jgi:hypothetical protein